MNKADLHKHPDNPYNWEGVMEFLYVYKSITSELIPTVLSKIKYLGALKKLTQIKHQRPLRYHFIHSGKMLAL